METWRHDSRYAGAFFALAVAAHLVFIMLPLAHKMSAGAGEQRSVRVRLVPEVRLSRQSPTAEEAPDRRVAAVPVLEELPPRPGAAAPSVLDSVPRARSTNSRRILSSQFDYEHSVRRPLFGTAETKADETDFHFRERATLETVLNQPSLQLPFEDTRTYLVDHYEDGIMGGIEKFWDRVTVPFGFTTSNNTRVQCVWVLVIAGCGWGHKSLFHQPARYRERPKSPSIEKG